MKLFALLFLGLLLFFAVASHRHAAVADEFGTIWLASQDSAPAIVSHVRSFDVHPPTAYLLLHAWGKLFGCGDAAMRLPSALAVLLSLAVLWKLLFRLRPGLAAADARLVLLLCATAPVLLLQAAVARYYAFATLLGLLALWAHLAWMQTSRRGPLIGYVAAALACFHLNYNLAVLVASSAALHYLATRQRAGRPALRVWLVGQSIIAVGALPVVLSSMLPLLTGANPSLAHHLAPEGLSGWTALPAVAAGHLFATLFGGVPFPWDFWVTAPVVVAAGLLLVRDLRGGRALLSAESLALCVAPFLLLALIVAVLLPVAGLFNGVFRVPHIAVLCWAWLGFLALDVRSVRLRRMALGGLFAGNLCCAALYAGNFPAMAQLIPMKEMAAEMRRDLAPGGAFVAHPMRHGWGDALQRYLPGVPTIMLESGPGANDVREAERAIAAVRAAEPAQVFILQRNRFPGAPDRLAAWLAEQGYAPRSSIDYQRQRALDRWCKDLIKRIPGLRYNPAPSSEAVWTLRRFERAPAI